ncbi:MAG: serine acetyltransferase [Chloroflexota bacterium]
MSIQPESSSEEFDKRSKITSVIYTFQILRALLHIFLFVTSASKSIIGKDIERWLQLTDEEHYQQLPKWKGLVWLLWRYQEYRNLFYYRIKRDRRRSSRILMEGAKLLYPPMNTLFIRAGTIGEGFFIQHGYATGISARSIGTNCWINQHVVIGYSDKGKAPCIGNNVRITAGAKIFGDITIGDNSIIGANAVVVKDVPPNCTVVGVPGYIVKRDGKKVREPL